jgi:hypothetical protein
MLEKLRKMLTDAGIDPAVGSMDYWQNELEGVLLDMYDQGAAAEREACAIECWVQMGLMPAQAWTVNPYQECIKAIRARGEK